MKNLTNWTETVGFAAVVLSLIFVGYEIRESTLATKAANHYALQGLMTNLTNTILESEELSHIDHIMQTSEGYADLTPLQKSRADSIRVYNFNIWEAAFYNHVEGQLDNEIWDAWNRYNRSILTADSWKAWQENKHHFGESFSKHVDNVFIDAGFNE